jgi:hypothetical protein
LKLHHHLLLHAKMNALQQEQKGAPVLPNIKFVEIMILTLALSGHQFKIVPQELSAKMENVFPNLLPAKMNVPTFLKRKGDAMETLLRKEIVEIMIPILVLSGLLGIK